jgi:hypothetical protein
MPDSTTPPSTDPQTLCYSSTAGCKRPGHGPYHWCDHPKGHDGPTGAAVEWSSCYPPRREAPDLSRGMKRVLRSREDSERQLQEQVGFLRTSSRLYDEGEQAEAKRLAGALRILLYDQGSCHSLLGQLGMLGEPRVLTGPAMLTGGEMPFAVWWEQDAILVDTKRTEITRKDVVRFVANQDGGAHFDAALDAVYHALSRGQALGWIVWGPQGGQPMDDPTGPCLRQIAREVVNTLDHPPADVPLCP